jgi:predicted NBD/HSP70 family sugar kinase
VSLSGLYGRLGAAGFGVRSPRALKKLPAAAQVVIDAWVEEAAEALVSPITAINCLINPEAILIGGRLPLRLVDQLTASLSERMSRVAAIAPAVATIARARTSQDAPAIGAAILPFHHELLPARSALSFKSGVPDLSEEYS